MILQPTLENALNDFFENLDGAIPIIYLDNALPTLGTLIASHTISGIILSPLEVVRTR
jgi:hypothetical protein